jgi:type I restriction enzyme S subunit
MAAVSDEGRGRIELETRTYREVRKGYTYFAEGDVLFAKITPCMQNGKIAVAINLIDGIGFGSTEFHVLRASVLAEPLWLQLFLQQRIVLDVAEKRMTGSVGQQRLPASFLIDLELPLPPLHEQRRIAAILDERLASVERAREAAEMQLAAAKALPAAYLRAVFDSDEAQTWPRVRLRDLCTKITDGTHQPPPFVASGIPFLFVRNIVGGEIDFRVEKHVSQETYEMLTARSRPERGDVLYSAVGSFGVAVVIETDQQFTFQRHIAHLKVRRDRIVPHYLAYFLNSPEGRRMSDEAALGGAQRTVTLSSLANFAIPLASVHRQETLVTELKARMRAVRGLDSAVMSELDAVNALPQALLREAFEGRL